jgi:hypothetical protein
MVTHAQVGTFKPNPRYANTASTAPVADFSPLPRSVHAAVRDPNWLAAMREEFAALVSNRTWELVPRPLRAHLITGKWVFRHKLRSDGSLERYKARWVVRGFTQRAGVDYGKPSLLSSSQRPFAPSSPSLHHAAGPSTNWT